MSRPSAPRTLLVMSPGAHRALAREWFLRGFSASGRGFNGDNFDREKYPALESLLSAYFDGVYDGQDPRQPRRGGPPRPPPGRVR